MQILEIKIPDSKARLIKGLLKELDVAFSVKKEKRTPNAETIAAMDELKSGKGEKFKSVSELFNSI